MRPIRPDEVAMATQTLVAAFHDDPMLQLVAPDPAKRPRAGEWFLGIGIKVGLQSGHVWVADDVSAVSIWFPPGETELSTARWLGAGMWQLPFKVGLRTSATVLQAISATEPFHKSVHGPHWYLLGLGTHPDRQGSGLGGALLEMGTSRADEAGLPCYLETATDANVEWYGRRGFEVIGEATVRGHRLRGMVRPAQVGKQRPSVDAELVEA